MLAPVRTDASPPLSIPLPLSNLKLRVRLTQWTRLALVATVCHVQDREGVHMIKVADPPASDRMVSVETFYILLSSTCVHVCMRWSFDF